MKKLILISFILLLSTPVTGITKEKLFMFTDIEKCKPCINPVLNAINYHTPLFDSLDINYELILKCRRSKDLEYYKHYFHLDSSLRIVTLTDSIKTLYNPTSTEQFFVLTRNDTIIFTTENLDLLLGYITR
ncbi:MAG: hypothetical protein CVV25_07910 [Ignavibacteriae bacterium HGW-Ignavibacteriae-4]|nr:MAG: hypothetical protein CVV25_07910 [Ignavibacteriae bacterium HGW-Ignavibacteriae-4]